MEQSRPLTLDRFSAVIAKHRARILRYATPSTPQQVARSVDPDRNELQIHPTAPILDCLTGQEQPTGPWQPDCFDCGEKKLEQFFTPRTSKVVRYALCPGCFEARQAKGRAKEANPA